MKTRFDKKEIETILGGLDMMRDEYEDEMDVLIRAVRGPDQEKVESIKTTYQEKRAYYGTYVARLKKKVLNQPKTRTNVAK